MRYGQRPTPRTAAQRAVDAAARADGAPEPYSTTSPTISFSCQRGAHEGTPKGCSGEPPTSPVVLNVLRTRGETPEHARCKCECHKGRQANHAQ